MTTPPSLPNTEQDTASAMPNKTTDDLIGHIISLMNFAVSKQYDLAIETLRTYPEELLHKLVDVAEQGTMWEHITDLIDYRAPATVLNEAIRFFPHLTTDNFAAAHAMLKSLHEYPQLPTMEDYSKADQRTQEQCIAILTVCDMLEQAPYYSFDSPNMNFRDRFPDKHQRYINQHEDIVNEKLLVDLLVEHPELAPRLGALIIERQTMDMGLLQEIIRHENPALSDGIL